MAAELMDPGIREEMLNFSLSQKNKHILIEGLHGQKALEQHERPGILWH